jgi:PAS domain S-box-containing protein
VAHSIEVPSEIIRKWQEFVNLLAEIMHVPSASIMRVDPPNIKVFVSSTSKGNPCEPGALDTGPYCETVMKTGQPLLVPDALENEAWKANPHVRLGMISYLGVPIGWPDGRLFGTICVRDNKRNEYSEAYLKLLLHFRDMLQADLKSMVRLHGEIEEREAKIRRLVDANIIGIFIWDFDGRILEANEAFLDIVGYDHEDLVAGRIRWTDLTPPEWRDRDTRLIQEHKVTGTLQPFEKEYFRKDGSRVPVLIGVATFEEGGNQGVAFVLDLTERKRAEQALRRNEAELIETKRELQQTIDIIPVLIGRYGADGKRDFVNATWKKYTGLSDEAALGTEWSIVAHPDDIAIGNKMWRDALIKGEPTHVEARLRRADGQYRWFAGDRVPLRDESGKVIKWYSTGYDIEDRKQAEDLLRRSEAHLAEAQRLSHTGAVVYNGTAILFASEETYRIWGFDPAQGLPSREAVFQRIHPGDRDWLNAEVRREVDEKRKFSIGYRIVLPDGTVKHLETIGQPVFSASGKLVEIFATQTDVTERKRAEERLRVQHTVAQILAEAATIEEATPRILLAMGECLGWDVGVLWRVDREPEALRCVELWHKASIEVPEFERVSRKSTFGPGLGLPGRVWSSLEPEYIPDVVLDENFPRAPIAEREGLRAALGFPILLGGEVLGVIEFFSREIKQPDQELLNVLAAIGSQIGQFIERKRGEEALRESEGKFRDYAETASDWFWEIGPDYKFTLLTENAFGSNAANRIGTVCWDHALDLETEPEKWRVIQATLDSRKLFRDFVYCGLSGDGTPMHVRASGKPMFDANGEFRGYRGTGTDVTAIMRAQEALRESERSARSAIDGIAGLVSILTPNGEVETVNRQCLEYFGRSLEELGNWQISDAVHPEDRPRILEFFKRAIASRIPFNFELRLRRFDGEYRWFDNRGVPIRDGSGRVTRWYVLLTDIEDRTQALARLEQMQSDFAHMNRVSVMGELAASLSHEITQPIASARNNACAALNFLDQQSSDLAEVRESLGCIVGDADRAGNIIDRIRDHIKKAPPRKLRLDLNAAIDEVIGLARSAIIKNGVSVQTRLAEGLLPVQGDRVQLQQVVLNLVLNAVEAMGSIEAGPRKLSIRTQQGQTGVLVAVGDSGPGIDPNHFERVFTSFYTTKSSGTGMGLTICRSIIDSHGGRMWADANEPRGAIFQFTLPGVEAGRSS